METISYLLKSGGILSLFYIVYGLLLKKDTLFNLNRSYLLIGILAAVTLPIIQFTNITIQEVSALRSIPTDSPFNFSDTKEANSLISIENLLIYTYLFGVAVFLSKFIYQCATLFILLKKHPSKKVDNYRLIEVFESISPFSFFNIIVYNPSLHSRDELAMIITHEQNHIKQLHSIDVLISNILIIVQWFNPLAWSYKKSIEENLEFLADRNTIKQVVSKKEYQLALIRTSSATMLPALTNYFHKSFIKKRIIMINKTNSNRKNALKATIVLPLLALFLWSFNVNEVTKYIEIPQENNKVDAFKKDEGVVRPISKTQEIITSQILDSEKNTTVKTNIMEHTQQSNQKPYRVKIDKNTTDTQLREIKEEVKTKFNLELTYATIRNKNKEITSLTLSYSGNGNNGNFQLSQDQGIDEFFFFIDKDGKAGFWSEVAEKRRKERMSKRNLKMQERSQGMTERTKEMQERIEEKRIEMEERRSKTRHNYQNAPTPPTPPNYRTREMRDQPNSKRQGDKKFVKADNPIYIIDGIESSKKQVELLLPENINKVNVLKGEKALKKYGGKGVNGAIEITTRQ